METSIKSIRNFIHLIKEKSLKTFEFLLNMTLNFKFFTINSWETR